MGEKSKELRQANKKQKKDRKTALKKYQQSPKGRANYLRTRYKKMDEQKGFEFPSELTPKWILNNIFNSSCVYCGETDWKKLGCDRIDNSKPHTIDNIVCACKNCNLTRQDKFSVEEFIEYRKTHPKKH